MKLMKHWYLRDSTRMYVHWCVKRRLTLRLTQLIMTADNVSALTFLHYEYNQLTFLGKYANCFGCWTHLDFAQTLF